jgi:exopolysaccharide biosynthesis protein
VNLKSSISNRYFCSHAAHIICWQSIRWTAVAKLALLAFVFLWAQASAAIPKGPLVSRSLTMQQQRVLHLSGGVVLTTEVLYMPAGPVLVNTLSIDLTNSQIHLGVVQANNRLVSSDERVSSMANRSGALAGINGDFFEIHSEGRPIGMEVIDGHLMQSPSIYAVLGITQSGQFSISHEKFIATVTDGTASFRLSSVNHFVELGEGKLGLITPAVGAPVPVWGDVVAMLQPIDGTPNQFTVRSVQPSGTVLPVLSKQDALVGRYAGGAWILAHLHKGDILSVNAKVSPDNQLFEALGGGPILVQNGAFYYDYPSPLPGTLYYRKPLTAVAVTRDGKHALFAVFDGRYSGPLRSAGMTPVQVAYYLMAHGAFQAMLFDGGGSSEMVARLPGHGAVSVVNYPSDGRERPVSNGLFIYISSSQSSGVPSNGLRACPHQLNNRREY